MRPRLLVFCTLVACSSPTGGGLGAGTDAAGGSVDAGLAGQDAVPDATAVQDSSGPSDVDPFKCIDGQLGCFNATTAKVCVGTGWQVLKKCEGGTFCLEGSCATTTDCAPGASLGCDGLTQQVVCSADGKAAIPQKCPGKQLCAEGKCRDVVCTPGSPECTTASKYRTCKADGSGWSDEVDCKSGAYCLGGTCVSLCETNPKIASNVGCEYWSVDLDNDPSKPPFPTKDGVTPEMIPHSVVLSNPGIYDAEVTFTVQSACADGATCTPGLATCGAKSTVCGTASNAYPLQFASAIVPAGASTEFKMPVMNVDGSSLTRKAIFVKSTQPVVAFQFNPFNSEGAATNDGSLLLPQNTLGKLYFAVSLPSTPDLPAFPQLSQKGFLTVVATAAGPTTVQVTPTADVIATGKAGVPQDGSKPGKLPKAKTYVFTLQAHDVLNLESVGGKDDLTGTRIEADKPVAVFSGHENSVVTDPLKLGDENFETCCTEHLEEQLMPVNAWGSEAFCVKAKSRGYDRDVWIVVAGQDNVSLTATPPIDGLNGKVLAKAGDSVRVQTDESFRLQATGKIQVVQLLVGQGQTTEKIGDPSMMIVPPRKQYRTDYVIRTADGYSKNWLTVVRPKGLAIQLDGLPIVSSFQAFGDGTWELAYVSVQTGTHRLEAAEPFGLMAYGFGNVTAYGYPGGMNLL